MIGTSAAADTFDVISPATGRVVGTHPRGSADDVDDAVRRAREVAGWWAALGFEARARRLDAWRGIIARRAPELAELTHIEMGKPQADAMLEIAMALEHLAWAAKNAARVLGRRTVRPSLLTVNQAAGVEYLPLGVAGSTALTGCGNSPSLVR